MRQDPTRTSFFTSRDSVRVAIVRVFLSGLVRFRWRYFIHLARHTLFQNEGRTNVRVPFLNVFTIFRPITSRFRWRFCFGELNRVNIHSIFMATRLTLFVVSYHRRSSESITSDGVLFSIFARFVSIRSQRRCVASSSVQDVTLSGLGNFCAIYDGCSPLRVFSW